MTKTQQVVFIPTPGMGHLLSMVEFAKLVVQTDQHISILVLVYHMPAYEPTKIEAYIEPQSSQIDPNRITFVSLPPLSNPPDPSSPTFFATLVELQICLIKQALADREAKPVAFVLDMMNYSMIDLANELHAPSYIYFTAGANLLNSMFHVQALADEKAGAEDITDLMGDLDSELDLPGFRNRVPMKVWPWANLGKENANWFLIIVNMARRFRQVKGILINTFMELETYGLEALHDHNNTNNNKIPPVYPVGPVIALQENNNVGSEKEDHESIIGWLDEQPNKSVVFLCFGSMGCFEADQVKELANGLDKSGHRFLWSLRKPVHKGTYTFPSEHEIFEEALPEGFLERTAHKGKIIAWAPQIAVLAHRAIGGFVSHCGWNSTLESLWFGVPLATWPVYSEQQLNAYELVKELGLAVEISLDYRWDHMTGKANSMITAEDIENGVKKLMSMDEEMRRKVTEMSNNTRKVLRDGGSSHNWLTRFISEVNGTLPIN